MLTPPPGTGPLLLVSVRNSKEARAAFDGGADIIDIKEPQRGSLGKADDAVIREIAETVRSLNPKIPISAALGELKGWKNPALTPNLPAEVDYVKLGLSDGAVNGDWLARWMDFRNRFEVNSSTSPGWVMVIYADWQLARNPNPHALVLVAEGFGFRGVLMDTFQKDGRSLLEVLSARELEDIAEAVHEINLPLAIAGSLRKADLPKLRRLKPQVVAIRSAACKDGQRDAEICPDAVREFREHLV